MQQYDDNAIASDDTAAAMNREWGLKRSREQALAASSDELAAPCREYAATLTFCLDYCSDDRERDVLTAAADVLIRIGGTPTAPPSDAFSRSPMAQVRRCALGMCRLARIAAVRETSSCSRAALALLIAATELLTLQN